MLCFVCVLLFVRWFVYASVTGIETWASEWV